MPNFRNQLLFSVLFFSLTFQILAQKFNNSISGYVIDDSTFEAIENANVYISNTTFGSSTDKEGFFIIKSIPPNFHELVVSVIGYKNIEIKTFIKKNSHIHHNFKLTPIIYESQAIDITSSTPDEWLQNLSVFKVNFLGNSFRAEKCTIENAEVLDFNKSSAILNATSQTPLIIKNNVLGFKIYCGALSFYFNTNQNRCGWSIKPRYEELIPSDSLQSHAWEINRRIAYFGSIYHFLLSLKQDKFTQNGYKIYYSKVNGVLYPTERHNIFLAERDSILKTGISAKYHLIHFNKYLLIRNYSMEEYFPQLDDLNVQFGNTYQNSWLELNFGEMTLDEYGYPVEENAFVVYGYWATLGIADLLPRYYELDKILEK